MWLAPTSPKGIKCLGILSILIIFIRLVSTALGITFIVFAIQGWSYFTFRQPFRQLYTLDNLPLFLVGVFSTLITILLTIYGFFWHIRLSRRISAENNSNRWRSTQRSCWTSKPLILRTTAEFVNFGLWMGTAFLFMLSPGLLARNAYLNAVAGLTSWNYVAVENACEMAVVTWCLSMPLLLLVIWEEIWVWRVRNKDSLVTATNAIEASTKTDVTVRDEDLESTNCLSSTIAVESTGSPIPSNLGTQTDDYYIAHEHSKPVGSMTESLPPYRDDRRGRNESLAAVEFDRKR